MRRVLEWNRPAGVVREVTRWVERVSAETRPGAVPWLAALAVIWQLAAVVAPAPAAAQELPAPPSLRVAVDTTTTTVGGRLHLTVAVEHAPDATVQWPDSLDLAPFEVLDAVVNPTTVADGRATTTAVLALAAFELGELEIPSFTVGVVSSGGVTALVTDPFGIAVVSVGLDEGQDIRDIRGPLSIPRSMLVIGLWLLALALAGGVGYWLARRARQRTTDEGPVTEGPPRPAHEVAYEELDWLESSELLGQGRIKEYYIEVSDIMRRYLEGRYAIRAPEMTSREVLEQLENTDIAWDVHDRFTAFMEHCDLVKFAKYRPGPTACGLIVPDARGLVDSTLPPPELESDEQGGEGSEEQEGGRRVHGGDDAQDVGGPEVGNAAAADHARQRDARQRDARQEDGSQRRSGTASDGAQPQAIPLASGDGR